MTTNIFFTGGTGYIGGSVLHTVASAHPEFIITVLLRKIPGSFASVYPNIRVVSGDYDSFEILANEAEKADIVVHNGNSDHEASLKALIAGLLRKSKPGYLLHLSGTGIVSDWSSADHLGKLNPKIWSDMDSLKEIRTLPTGELHRNTEIVLHDTIRNHPNKINIAIMCPPDIYGRGKGLARTQSALVPIYVKEIQNQNGKVFYYNQGTNTRSWVHIDDLMNLYLHIIEAAASGRDASTYFNDNGYYFASTQEYSQLELARAVGQILHQNGVIKDPQPVQISLADLDIMVNVYPAFPKLARYLFASNSRTRPTRAERLFGYKSQAPDLLQELENDILDTLKRP